MFIQGTGTDRDAISSYHSFACYRRYLINKVCKMHQDDQASTYTCKYSPRRRRASWSCMRTISVSDAGRGSLFCFLRTSWEMLRRMTITLLRWDIETDSFLSVPVLKPKGHDLCLSEKMHKLSNFIGGLLCLGCDAFAGLGSDLAAIVELLVSHRVYKTCQKWSSKHMLVPIQRDILLLPLYPLTFATSFVELIPGIYIIQLFSCCSNVVFHDRRVHSFEFAISSIIFLNWFSISCRIQFKLPRVNSNL